MEMLLIACVAFVGSHFLLSHPLRAPLVGAIGEGPFLGLYSLVAFATLGWVAYAFHVAPAGPLLASWLGVPAWEEATVIMLLASILLVGSFRNNPAAPSPGKAPDTERAASGVFAITRHPMMWAFALWGFAHILVMPTLANVILCLAIIILALGGAWGQDRKKERIYGDAWKSWKERTSYVPFAAQVAGKARWRDAVPGRTIWLAGIVLWLAATYAHGDIGAGIWRWQG